MKKLLKVIGVSCLCMMVLCGMRMSVEAGALIVQEEVTTEENIPQEPGGEGNIPQEPEKKILMIGNSFTKRGTEALASSNVGKILGSMAVENNKKIKVDTIVYGGAYLYYYAFWSNPYKHYYESVMSALKEEQYDYIILQEQTTTAIENYENFMLPSVKQLMTYINAYQSNAKIWIYQTAPFEDGKKITVDGEKKLISLQEFLERSLFGYARLQATLDVEGIPVGMQTYHSTQLYPEIKMVSNDKRHPAYAGYYMAALNIYYKLFDEVPVNIAEDLKVENIGEEQILLLNELVKDDIILNKTELSIAVGESQVLEGEIVAAEDRKGTLFWKSLYPEIATVNEGTGEITGIAEGTTIVLAETTTGLMKACLITVKNEEPLELSFGRSYYIVAAGDTIYLKPQIKNWKADDILEWSSGSTAVATVSADGKVSAKKMGRAVIKVKSTKNPDISASYKLYVKAETPEKVSVNVKELTATDVTTELLWQSVYGAQTYRIYRYDNISKSYQMIGTSTTNAYIDNTAKVNISYKYKVTAMPGSTMCESDYSEEVAVMGLGTVENQIEVMAKDYVKLKWNMNENATGYEIYRSEEENGVYEKITAITQKDQLYYYDYNLTKGKTYYYKIRVYREEADKISYSVDSNIAEGGILDEVIVSECQNQKTYVKLTWAESMNATGYEIYRSETEDSGYEKVGSISGKSILYYQDKSVESGKTYYYKVKACNTKSENISYSDDSNIVKGGKLDLVTILEYQTKAKYVKLTWTKSVNATGYEIYRSEKKNSGYKKIKTISKNSKLYYQDKSVESGKTYYYKIKAYSKGAEKTFYSQFSGIVKGGRLDPVTPKKCEGSQDYIKLTWKKSVNATGYVIYRSENQNGKYKKIGTITQNKQLYYKDRTAKSGKKYYYKIKAYKTNGEKDTYSSSSEIVSGKLKL